MRDGVLVGLDLAALQAGAALADPARGRRPPCARPWPAAVPPSTGWMPPPRLAAGRASLAEGRIATEGGGAASIAGDIDLARATLDLRLAARPVAEAPEIGLRLTGPLAEPRRLPELAPFLRWRAER